MGQNENKGETYSIFLRRCDEICNAKFIMSCSKINSLLQYMPTSECIMEFVASCNQGESYKQLYSLSSQGNVFKLPKSRKKIVCVVTGLLFDIDQMNIDFNVFLRRYFYADDLEESFKAFCSVIMHSYEKAFLMMLENFDDESSERLEDGFASVDKAINEQVFPLLTAFKDCVMSDGKLVDLNRKDAMTLLDGLVYAFELGNAKVVLALWVGLKNFMRDYKNGASYLSSLEKMLSMFNII